MAGRTWRDLKRSKNDASARTQDGSGDAPDKRFNNSFGTRVKNGRIAPAQQNNAMQQSPRLSKLMEERKSLEDKMNILSAGGDQLNPRDSARFSVPSFADRRAEQQQWDQRRDSIVSQRSSLRNAPSQDGSSSSDLSQWLNSRDEQRRSTRKSARARLSTVNDVGNSASRGIDSLNNLSRQLDQIDQMSIDQDGGSGTAMRDLNMDNVDGEAGNSIDGSGGSGLNDLSLDNRPNASTSHAENGNRSGSSALVDLRKKIKKPLDEIKKIEKSWEEKRDSISGAMDKIGPYVDKISRRLSVDEGGSGNIIERMKRNKEKALARRKEINEQEQKDEKRRKRASKNRLKKDKEKV